MRLKWEKKTFISSKETTLCVLGDSALCREKNISRATTNFTNIWSDHWCVFKEIISFQGLSVRSVFFNVFQSVIVLLYVLDNETNTIIKISCAVGLAIEVWKINKVPFSVSFKNILYSSDFFFQ